MLFTTIPLWWKTRAATMIMDELTIHPSSSAVTVSIFSNFNRDSFFFVAYPPFP